MTAIKLTLEHSVSHTGSNTKQLLTYRALNLKSQWCTHTQKQPWPEPPADPNQQSQNQRGGLTPAGLRPPGSEPGCQ